MGNDFIYDRFLAGNKMSNTELIERLKSKAAIMGSDFADVADLLTEAAAALEANEWKPIESAPLETDLIVFGGVIYNHGSLMGFVNHGEIGSQDRNGIWFTNNNFPHGKIEKPTHWQPLPKPPKETQE